MNDLSLREPQMLGTLAVIGLFLGGAVLYLRMRKKPDPDLLERERRDMLVAGGRIIDGTVLDVSELSPEESGRPNGLQLILYQYEIAGVVYEASQDVTLLKDLVDIHKCRLGFPASVRYDVRRPENSIIVAENWSGLRDTATSIPIRKSKSRRPGIRAF